MAEAAAHLKLLVAISDWRKAGRVVELLRGDVFLHYQFKAEGTANSDILDMFGLGSTDKFVSFCMALATDSKRILLEFTEAMDLQGKGKGIAFSIPMSGAGMALHRMLEAQKQERGEADMEAITQITQEVLGSVPCEVSGGANGAIEEPSKEPLKDSSKELPTEASKEVPKESHKEDLTHDLIMAVVNRGYSEELMDAARSAGARGGTVIHAKRADHDGPSRFFGICAQAEKEIVMILVPRKERTEIMKAISHRCGVKSDAQGITFSLPVDGVYGLSVV